MYFISKTTALVLLGRICFIQFSCILGDIWQDNMDMFKHSKECFIRYPNTPKWVKKNSAAPHFSNQFSVFDYPDKTLFLVFEILKNKLSTYSNPLFNSSGGF